MAGTAIPTVEVLLVIAILDGAPNNRFLSSASSAIRPASDACMTGSWEKHRLYGVEWALV